jgi:uncharacterized membrane protein
VIGNLPGEKMKVIKEFLKTTIVGGLMFLLPLILLLLVLKQALQLVGKLSGPIVARFSTDTLLGVSAATLTAVAVLLVIAFLAGMAARTAPGRRISAWIEESILGGLPQYRMAKSMAEGFAQIESGAGMHPVLVRLDDAWQLAYRIEDLPGGWVAVFVPAAPTPMSGNVLYVAARRVQSLSISMPAAMKLVKAVGVGSLEALRGIDLGDSREG